MSTWITSEHDRTTDGIPHLTKIIRKPKGVGTEVKCIADGMTGITLQLEVCDGKEAESRKKLSSAFSSLTTAIECCVVYSILES